MIDLLLAATTIVQTPEMNREQQINKFCAYVVGIPYASDNFTDEEFQRFQVCVKALE